MADSYLIQIDLVKMADNLSKGESVSYDKSYAISLLLDNGFIHRMDDWFICEEVSLAYLGKDEIKATRLYA